MKHHKQKILINFYRPRILKEGDNLQEVIYLMTDAAHDLLIGKTHEQRYNLSCSKFCEALDFESKIQEHEKKEYEKELNNYSHYMINSLLICGCDNCKKHIPKIIDVFERKENDIGSNFTHILHALM